MKPRIDYFDSTSLREDLKGKTVRGGLVSGVSQAIGVLVSFASLPVLARLLQPEDFGLVAMVMVFTNFAAMFVDAGLSMATVQRPEITRQQATNLFWISGSLGLAIACVVAAASPAVAWLYGRPELIPITLALTCSFVMAGLTVQHQALLTRAMQFHRSAIVTVASQVAGVGCAIAWASRFEGQTHDYWALVLMPLAAALTRMVGVWLACHWRPGLPRRGAGTHSMLRFGANLTGFNFVNYFSRNADRLLIGWWWGEVLLGYYVQAYKLFLFPLQQINSPLSAVMTPALSRVATNRDQMVNAYLRVLRPLLLVVAPGIALLGVTAEWWTELVLGPEWLPAAPILRCLAVVGIVQPFSNSVGWLFVAQGKAKEMLLVGAMSSASVILAFVIGLPFGPVGVAAAYAASGLLFRIPNLLYWIHRYQVFPVRVLVRELASLLPVVSAVIIANALLRWWLADATAWVGASASLVVTAFAWAAAVLATGHGRRVLRETLALRYSLSPRPSP